VKTKYEIIRNVVREKMRDLRENVKSLKNLTDQGLDVKQKIMTNELILKQSDTDLAMIHENLIQIKHDEQRLKLMHPHDPELRTVKDRIQTCENENEILYVRLEHWLYPICDFIDEDEQEEAIKYLASVEWQRALHQAIKPI
jgi:hypothetical protein